MYHKVEKVARRISALDIYTGPEPDLEAQRQAVKGLKRLWMELSDDRSTVLRCLRTAAADRDRMQGGGEHGRRAAA